MLDFMGGRAVVQGFKREPPPCNQGVPAQDNSNPQISKSLGNSHECVVSVFGKKEKYNITCNLRMTGNQ